MRSFRMLFAVAGCLWGAAIVTAADESMEAPPQSDPAARLQEIATRLELTDEQKAAIAPILRKEIADLKAVRDDTSMRRLQKARRVKEITETASRQIRALLTPAQHIEYDAVRAEMREKMKARAKERRNAQN